MPDPFAFLPTGLWGDEYREAGGLVVPDMLAQQEAESLRRQQAYDEAQAQADQQRMALQSQEQEAKWAEASAAFVDWPTYLKSPEGAAQSPHQAYDDYVSLALPFHLQRMGYSPEEIQQGVQQFMQMVPRPDADYGVVGNLWESLKGGLASGPRALGAAASDVTGNVEDVARRAVASATDEPVSPRLAFDRARRGGTAFVDNPLANVEQGGGPGSAMSQLYDEAKLFVSSAVQEPMGLFNEAVFQSAQSVPVIAAGLAALLIPSPGATPAAVGASSFTLDTGAELMQNVIEEARNQGVNINDAAAMQAMLQQPGVYARLREQAAAHGFGVAATDAGLAAISLGFGRIAGKLIRAGRPLRAGGVAVGGLGVGAVGSGAGEAAGTALAGKPFDPRAVIDEAMLGFLPDAVFEGVGAIQGMRRNPLQRPPPGAPPELTDVPDDFEEGDIPGSFPGGGSPPNVFRTGRPPAVFQRRGPLPVGEVSEAVPEDVELAPPPGLPTIGVTEEIPVTGVEELPGIGVEEIAPDEITIHSPARTVQEAQRRLEASALAEYPPLDVRNPDAVNQWLADRGVVMSSKEQMDAVANVLAAPVGERQAAIADSIDGLSTSREAGAEPLTDALMAMSRILPKDPVRKIKFQELGIERSQVPGVAASALAQEIQTAIQGGVTDGPTTEDVDTDPFVTTPVAHVKRGLARGESLPATDLGSLARQLGGAGPSQAAGGAQAPQVQPGGGLRTRGAQARAAKRGLARGPSALVAGSEGSPRVVADDTGSARRDGGLARKPKIDTKRGAALVAMTKEEYESTYPGRKYEEDLKSIVELDSLDRQTVSEGLSPGLLRALQLSNVDGVLQYLGATMSNPLARLIANHIRSLGLDVRFAVVPGLRNSKGQKVSGNYSTLTGEAVISIDPTAADSITVLHELIHAAAAQALENPQTASQKAAAEHMNALYLYAKDRVSTPNDYGFTNVQEFVAEALANPAFQKKLADIPIAKSKYGVRNLLDLFKRLVLRLLGFDKSTTVLSEAVLTASDLFSGTSETSVELAEKRRLAVPSNALVGMKAGARTFIAYQPKGKPDAFYTLYATANDPRGDSDTKVEKLTREEAEEYIRAAGSEVIAPASDTQISRGIPANSERKLVGYEGADLRAAAFQQKDGTWTYYESDADVRTDPDAKAYKGLSKDQVQRYINNKGFATTPPKVGAVKPASSTPTTVGYEPVGNFRYYWQDTQAPIKAIGKSQGALGFRPSENVEVTSTLRNSRVQTALDDARKKYVEPAHRAGLEIIERFGKKQEDIETTVKNLHIVERMTKKIQQTLRGRDDAATQTARNNKSIANRTAAEQALTRERNSNPQYVQAVEQQFAPKLRALTNATTDLAAQYGRYSRDVAEAIKAAYDYYVPLQYGEKTTMGKIATGANVQTDQSFRRVVEQLHRVINQGETNRVVKSVADLMRKHGVINTKAGKNGEPVGTVGDGVKVIYDPETASLSEATDSHLFDPNSTFFYEEGMRVPITIANDPVLLKALSPYKGVDRNGAIASLMAVSAWMNRLIAVGKTSANLAFPFGNVQRDIQAANVNLPAGVSRVRFNVQLANPANLAEVTKNVLLELAGQDPTGLYKQVKRDGGFISHRDYVGLKVLTNDLDTYFKPSQSWRGRNALLRHASSKTFETISLVAQISESVPRFAMYRAAYDSFMEGRADTEANRKEARLFAAHAAKTASVNFEQRGEHNLSSWWIFGNAKMQGITALSQSLQRMGLTKSAALLGGITLLGYLIGNAQQDGEKDKDGKPKSVKVSDQQKDNKVFLNEGGWAMSLSQEISPFYVMGHAFSEYNRGNTDGAHTASRITTSLINNAWPGNVPQQEIAGHKADAWNFFVQSLMPSAVLPFVQIGAKKNVFGNPIIPGLENKLAQGMPKSEMGSANENQLAVNVAKGLYKGTGGAVDIAPQELKLLHNYFDPMTEVWAFMRDIAGARESKYPGDVVNPIVRRLTANATPFYDQEQFDELLAKATRAQFLAQGKPGVAQGQGIESLSPEDQVLARSATMLKKIKSDISSMFKGSALMSKEQRDALSERARERLLEGIRRYNEMRDRSIPKL